MGVSRSVVAKTRDCGILAQRSSLVICRRFDFSAPSAVAPCGAWGRADLRMMPVSSSLTIGSDALPPRSSCVGIVRRLFLRLACIAVRRFARQQWQRHDGQLVDDRFEHRTARLRQIVHPQSLRVFPWKPARRGDRPEQRAEHRRLETRQGQAGETSSDRRPAAPGSAWP